MDIAGLSMLSNQMANMSQVALAVTKLAMSTATEQADGMSELLQQSVEPGKGASLDISV